MQDGKVAFFIQDIKVRLHIIPQNLARVSVVQGIRETRRLFLSATNLHISKLRFHP
jgi:hypothetical protein